MNDKQNIKTEPTPLIKYGWLRAILFLIAALIASAIFTFIGMMVLGLDFYAIATNARDFIKDIGLPANITITFFGFMGMLGIAWIFRVPI